MTPCIQELRIKALEDRERESATDISNLSITVNRVVGRLDTLIKVLLLIAAKISIAIFIILWYFVKLYVIN